MSKKIGFVGLGAMEALALLIGDPTRRRTLGVAGRHHVTTYFSVTTMLDGMEALLQDVVRNAEVCRAQRCAR